MTILDKSGADKLLGKGDMLYNDGVNESRVQGAYISLEEITAVTDYLKEKYAPDFLFSKEDLTEKMRFEEEMGNDPRNDEYFEVIAEYVVENNNASINRIQNASDRLQPRPEHHAQARRTRNRFRRHGRKPRTVLVTMEELEEILNQ